MSELTTMLQNYGCREMDVTLERFLGDESFYLSILNKVIVDPGFERLGDELQGTDAEEAFNTAHMLKGIIANCGLTPLYELITEIVEPLRKGKMDGLLPIYNNLMTERNSLAAMIEAISI